MVLLCLYVLTPAFYYIPDAILSAVIIHAVADLVSGPKFLVQLFRVNPFESFTFLAAVLVTFFTSVEYGIYVSVALSIIVLLLRIARPRYAVLGRVAVHAKMGCNNPDEPLHNEKEESAVYSASTKGGDTTEISERKNTEWIYVEQNHKTLGHLVQEPPKGVVIFRLDESLTYPNAGFVSDKFMQYIQDKFHSGSPSPTSKGEQAWNDHRPLAKSNTVVDEEHQGDSLCAIVLDCSGINHLDSTGLQILLDLKLCIDRFAGYEVEWHFSSLSSPTIRNALVTGGFGTQAGRGPRTNEVLSICPEIVTMELALADISFKEEEYQIGYYSHFDRGLPVDRYLFFHWDLEDAVRAASSCTNKLATA